jgi:multidrug transporter EmrE-like cation transporter/ketosteroid isomerase-like protein
MAWLFLLFAAACEMAWPIGFKYTNGFRTHYPFIALTLAIDAAELLADEPVGQQGDSHRDGLRGVEGLGAAGTVIPGMIMFKEPRDADPADVLAVIIVGVVGAEVRLAAGAAEGAGQRQGAASPAHSAGETDCRRQRRTKAVVLAYVDAFNRGDVDGVCRLFTPEALVWGVLGWGAMDVVRPVWRELVERAADEAAGRVDRREGDVVAVRYTERGTSVKSFRRKADGATRTKSSRWSFFELREGLIHVGGVRATRRTIARQLGSARLARAVGQDIRLPRAAVNSATRTCGKRIGPGVPGPMAGKNAAHQKRRQRHASRNSPAPPQRAATMIIHDQVRDEVRDDHQSRARRQRQRRRLSCRT